MKTVLKNFLKFLVFTSIGVGILYLIYNNQSKNYLEECVSKGNAAADCSLMDKLWLDFTTADFKLILLVIAFFLISNVSRALRWMMLLRGLGKNVRFINAFLAIMLNYFTNLGVPRIGEVIRAGVITKYEHIPVEKVIGTVVVDRMVDIISILFAIVLAFFVEFDIIYGFFRENLSGSPLWNRAILFAGIGIVILAYITWRYRKRFFASGLFNRVRHIIEGFGDGLKTIRSLDNSNMFIVHSIVIWIMYFLMTYVCFFAFVPTEHLGLSAALIVFVFGGLGVVFPSPGGMGTYHAMVIAALAIYGVSADDGFSFANLMFFSINLFCNITLGLFAVILLPLINREVKPAHA